MNAPDETWMQWLGFAAFVVAMPLGMFFVLFPASLGEKVEDSARQAKVERSRRFVGAVILIGGVVAGFIGTFG